MNTFCTSHSDFWGLRLDTHFPAIFSQALSAVDYVSKAVQPQVMLKKLDLLVMIAQYASKNHLAVSPDSFASLQGIIKNIQDALKAPLFRKEFSEEEFSWLIKVYQELTKIACIIAIDNDKELHSLFREMVPD